MDILNYYPISPLLATSGQPIPVQFQQIAEVGYQVVINLALTTSSNAIDHEDRRRQHDFIVGWVVVGVVVLRVHFPFGAVNLLAVFVKHVGKLPAVRVHHVAHIGVSAHFQ